MIPIHRISVVKMLPSIPNFPPVSMVEEEFADVLNIDSVLPEPLTLMPKIFPCEKFQIE